MNQAPTGAHLIHVIPQNDTVMHVASQDCWCHPLEKEPRLWSHNAKDCREAYERRTSELKSSDQRWFCVAARPPGYAPPDPARPAVTSLRVRRWGRLRFGVRWDWTGFTITNRAGNVAHCWFHAGPTTSPDGIRIFDCIIGPLGVALGWVPRA